MSERELCVAKEQCVMKSSWMRQNNEKSQIDINDDIISNKTFVFMFYVQKVPAMESWRDEN
jgi:hypothetical protein